MSKAFTPNILSKPPLPKGKTVRFSQLVATSGKPEIFTLWAASQKDRTFMGLVNKKKVITIIQNPVGNKKDIGYIGFQPQPFAVFMVFPKPLQYEDGIQIIGIKYDLLKTDAPQKETHSNIVKLPLKSIQASIERSYRVRILRTLSEELEMEVTAINLKTAKENALAAADEQEPPPNTQKVSNKIIEITEGY